MSILVVGAIHHDVIVDAPRLPRVDETVPGGSVRYAFGGKGGNQAVAAARMASHPSVAVHIAACLGHDAQAESALSTLHGAGVETGLIQRVDVPSGMSVAISLPDGNYGAVIVSGSNRKLDAEAIHLPSDLTWLVLQNELPEQLNLAVAQRARALGAKVLLNAAPARPLDSVLAGLVDLLLVNRVEAADLAGLADDAFDPNDVLAAMERTIRVPIVLTLGGEGVHIASNGTRTVIGPHRVPVISTHGAGDAFAGALVSRMAAGAPLVEAATFANAAAALYVSVPVDDRASFSAGAVDRFLAQTDSR